MPNGHVSVALTTTGTTTNTDRLDIHLPDHQQRGLIGSEHASTIRPMQLNRADARALASVNDSISDSPWPPPLWQSVCHVHYLFLLTYVRHIYYTAIILICVKMRRLSATNTISNFADTFVRVGHDVSPITWCGAVVREFQSANLQASLTNDAYCLNRDLQ